MVGTSGHEVGVLSRSGRPPGRVRPSRGRCPPRPGSGRAATAASCPRADGGPAGAGAQGRGRARSAGPGRVGHRCWSGGARARLVGGHLCGVMLENPEPLVVGQAPEGIGRARPIGWTELSQQRVEVALCICVRDGGAPAGLVPPEHVEEQQRLVGRSLASLLPLPYRRDPLEPQAAASHGRGPFPLVVRHVQVLSDRASRRGIPAALCLARNASVGWALRLRSGCGLSQ